MTTTISITTVAAACEAGRTVQFLTDDGWTTDPDLACHLEGWAPPGWWQVAARVVDLVPAATMAIQYAEHGKALASHPYVCDEVGEITAVDPIVSVADETIGWRVRGKAGSGDQSVTAVFGPHDVVVVRGGTS